LETDYTKPISDFRTSALVIVRSFGCCSYKKRLTDLGIGVGSTIKVIRNNGAGPLLLMAKGIRFAIGRVLAEEIICEETQEE
jgi:Fe2+ transport system protein FeoA